MNWYRNSKDIWYLGKVTSSPVKKHDAFLGVAGVAKVGKDKYEPYIRGEVISNRPYKSLKSAMRAIELKLGREVPLSKPGADIVLMGKNSEVLEMPKSVDWVRPL